ncbi:indole-3-glycerol phosphate synthase [Alkalihalobacillus xiaoxiensis]|uniref:indole-3-glycerol-phosphate synthase n=1 Tax=Shouchella xiaoxiensis TaxID=766895 RepID=A0ABS2SXD7_9BACI|nr:indole-3-glycerol phosphate synthase TrpC [Shouchella xiaoxiensis]MBM7840163.1 indole-3-glycerol phosphate synthase [Shouchella xiaoxiensis]
MLNAILKSKQREIETLQQPERQMFERKSLIESLRSPVHALGLIAEIKQASPSKGLIVDSINPQQIAMDYERAGASAISVLTDEPFFKGNKAYIAEVKQAVQLPVLRKDFILSEQQVEETARLGADAMLLIAGTVSMTKLKQLYQEAYNQGLECLVEVHSAEELRAVLLHFEPEVIGINNRNLNTFETSIKQTELVAPEVPETSLLVSESGIHTADDVQQVQAAGAQALLIGELLMRQLDKGATIRQLFRKCL